jgi:hypothetical protein
MDTWMLVITKFTSKSEPLATGPKAELAKLHVL